MEKFRTTDPTPDLMAWCAEHELDPAMISKVIVIDDDGLVHLQRHLLRDGKKYVGADGDIAWEPVVVQPLRPFPR